MRAVPQSSVRSLDDGGLPRLRRLLHAGRRARTAKIRANESSSTAAAANRSIPSVTASFRRNSSAAKRPTAKGKDRRQMLADWIASPENPYFPRHIANLIWAQYMGRGIVEPVDDVRISNPASNPELLDALAKKIVEYNYDLRRIVRDICNSRTYQLTTRANETQRARRTQLRQGHDPPDARRGDARLHHAGHRDEGQIPRPAAGRARRGSRRRQDLELLPDHLRPRDREDDLQPRRSRADASARRCTCSTATTVEGKITQGGVVKKLMEANKTPREIVQELVSAQLRPLADRGGTREAGAALGRHRRAAEGLSRHLLGAAQRQGIHVQPLISEERFAILSVVARCVARRSSRGQGHLQRPCPADLPQRLPELSQPGQEKGRPRSLDLSGSPPGE